MEIEEKMAEKSEDQPANARESVLEAICEKVEEFRENPSYKTREVLLSLVCNHDLNQSTGIGLMRVTEYEVATINYLYMIGAAHQINSLKIYLYDLITETTRLQKIMSWCNPVLGANDEDAARIITYEEGLMLPLKLYHFAYQKYTIEKELPVVSDKFSKYIEGALRNYENKKGFLDTKERPFRQFYVCNDVCQRMREVRRNPNGELRPDYKDKQLNRAMSNIMLDNLGRNFCVFSGIGGMGKSMLLIKFLLDEAESYKPGGRVPIMVTLRSYKPDEKNLETLLAMELKRFDPALQLSDLYYLLDTGRAVCLLDGFDEVNRDYINDFQDELDVIKDGRLDTFFIMSSRDIPEIRTLNHYFEYDLQNLNLEQACELINRLDSDRVDDELKKDFINKLQKDTFRFNRDEKRDFVGNPLFLSLMIRTYDMIHDIPTQRYVFYEKTYIAMASEYDSKTKRMTRPFFTGLNEKTFQKYFAEFCALTYSDSKYEFDRDLMMEYFYQVVEDNGLNIDPELFIRDVTEKLCLIYKDGSVYEFIHRSFQEYFAAFYYLMMLSIDKDTVIETLKALDEKIRKDETLSMMYGMDDKTMEKYVILPFLEEMFAYNNDDADYKDYLRKYYPRLEYVTGDLDEDMCSNDDHTSAMYCFIKKQFGIGHGYISMSFERDEGYADDSEEYFWIAEC